MRAASTIVNTNQYEFSSVLFDALFSLILFFSLDYFLEITNKFYFLFYLSTSFILMHWWLLFKTADDSFGTEVSTSTLDIVIGILEVIILDFIILYARRTDIGHSIFFIICLFVLDLIWALIWRYIGTWQTNNNEKIIQMESELENTIFCDILGIISFSLIFMFSSFLSDNNIIILVLLSYLFYIFLTFKTKIIDFKIF